MIVGGEGGTLSQRSRNRRKSDRIRVAETPDRILCTTCVYHLFWASQTTENPEQADQSRLLNESEVEFKHLRSGIEIACKAWAAERGMLREYVSNVAAEWARRSAMAN